MSGIAGFYQNKFDYTDDPIWGIRLNKMKDSLIKRGPDGSGICLLPHCGLAHSKLNTARLDSNFFILCLPMNQPPFKDDESYSSISFDGKLFNTKELKALLHRFPIKWKTSDDAEIVLNGYQSMGTDFFKELNGSFAFALYDAPKNALLLVRDHVGTKPLFYQSTAESFVFASEAKVLFAYGIRPRLNEESWGEVLGLGPARTPGHGVFVDMKEVLPGNYIVVHGDQIKQISYWKLESSTHHDSYEDTLDYVSWLVHDSVLRQLEPDDSVCTLLSGGLDSSLISAICNEKLKMLGKQLTTFSFDFVGNNQNFEPNAFQSSLDRPFVEIMVKHLNSDHTFLECNNFQQIDLLLDAVVARDLPCMADIESSLLYFCNQVAQKRVIAFTGECADEIFGGYPWFHKEELLNKDLFPWSYDLSTRTQLLRGDLLDKIHLNEYVHHAYETSLKETPYLAGEIGLEKRRREVAWLNIRWVMATLLNRMDRTSMFSGLEARVPFADPRILTYVFNIPWKMKCHHNLTKSLLIETGRGLLPNDILFRKKSPYPKTYDTNYEKLLIERLQFILNKASSPLREIVDLQKVSTFLESPKDYGRPWYGQLMAGPQMIAYLVQLDYWLDKYQLI
jgi:asparagine synthase (glutamine-hydrolysing)